MGALKESLVHNNFEIQQANIVSSTLRSQSLGIILHGFQLYILGSFPPPSFTFHKKQHMYIAEHLSQSASCW